MKVLFANKYFFRKGGAETVMFDEIEFMNSSHVEVVEFAMKHPHNLPSRYSPYFVSEKNYDSPSVLTSIKSAATFIHNWEAVKKISRLIRAERPDILHCHNVYHQLTPSIITAAARLRVPVVLTLHDLKTVCPIHTQWRNNETCTACSQNRFEAVMKHRCADGSPSKSALLWAEARYHSLKGTYERVSKVIAPSQFMRRAAVARFGAEKMVHIPNGIDVSGIEADPPDGDFVLYFGRLSPEKGVESLLQAHAEDGGRLRLVVAGSGPSAHYFKSRYQLAEFTGHLSGPDLRKRIREASVVVVPSECEENCPLSVLEAMACGKPIVASHIGGIPELVRHGRTGFLFRPKDRRDLYAKVRTLIENSDLRKQFGRQARKVAEEEYSLKRHGQALLSLYREISGTA